MNISLNTRQAYSEVDEFLELLNENKRNEIPKKLRDFFKEEKDKEYNKKIDKNIPIKDQNLKKETLAIIGLLNLQYWCKDEEEKERLKEIYTKNEKEYQNILTNKYNAEDMFKQNNENIAKDMQLVEYKESFFQRIMNKVKRILHLG